MVELGRLTSTSGMVHVREQRLLEELSEARPTWSGLVAASEVIGDTRGILLHAGPPYKKRSAIPVPVKQSAALACLYEGWASDLGGAMALVESGQVQLQPGQEAGVLVPLAAVVSPSMQLVMVDANLSNSRPRFSPLHEGLTHTCVFGTHDLAYPEHRRWVDTEVADWVRQALRRPMGLRHAFVGALRGGDDGHGQSALGSSLLKEGLVTRSSTVPSASVMSTVLGSPLLALGPWMAMAASLLSNLEGSSLVGTVTGIGGNGVDLGLRMAGLRDAWVVCESPRLRILDSDVPEDEGLPVVGDSAVIDLLGAGGQIAGAARSHETHSGPGSAFAHASLSILDDRPGIFDVEMATAQRSQPTVHMGVVDRRGKRGRIGPGRAEVPLDLCLRARALLRPIGDADVD